LKLQATSRKNWEGSFGKNKTDCGKNRRNRLQEKFGKAIPLVKRTTVEEEVINVLCKGRAFAPVFLNRKDQVAYVHQFNK